MEFAMRWNSYAETFPLLEGKEYEAFRADIAANGQRDTIKYRMVGKEKEYLDGRNRVRALDDLGMPYRDEKVVVTDEGVKSFIDSCNLHRRHLTPEQASYFRGKEYLAELNRTEQLAVAEDGKNRGSVAAVVAERHDVAERTIHNDAAFAKQVDAVGQTQGQTAKRKVLAGESGKSRRAIAKGELLCFQCKQLVEADLPPIRNCKVCQSQRDNQPLRDADGVIVPQQLVKVFQTIPLHQKFERQMDAAAKTLKEIESMSPNFIKKPGDDGHYKKLLPVLRNFRKQYAKGRPADKVCECEGQGCKACNEDGYLSVAELEAKGEELR